MGEGGGCGVSPHASVIWDWKTTLLYFPRPQTLPYQPNPSPRGPQTTPRRFCHFSKTDDRRGRERTG